jgi:hypothetical protein
LLLNNYLILFEIDSPGVPPSANAHELFRGFSFVDPTLLDDEQPSAIMERIPEPMKVICFSYLFLSVLLLITNINTKIVCVCVLISSLHI